MRKVIVGLIVALVVGAGLFFGYVRWLKRVKEPKPSRVLEEQITSFSLQDPKWQVSTSPEQLRFVNDLFSQHFYFMGKGKQCLAFGSYDGKYVIKFLLQKPLLVKRRFKKLPKVFPFTLIKRYKVKERDERRQNLFNAFMLSYKDIPEETGTVFLHLNATKDLFKKPLIVDMKENPVTIDPDNTQFIIQRRARHIKPIIIDLMRDDKLDEAKVRVDQVLMLLFDTVKKGVVDIDTGLIRNNNIGFLDDRAIYVDTGKLRKVKPSKKAFIKDLRRLKPFHKWLRIYYPELASHFQEKQQKLIQTF